MNTILWLLAGALLGWVGYAALKLNEPIGKTFAMVIGAVAGILGGKLVAPLFAGAELTPGGFSPSALFFAVATSTAILVAVHMGMARWYREK